MRKVLTIAVAAIMIAVLMSAACATETSWRIKFGADNGSGGSPASGAQLGVLTGASDDYSSAASDDGTPYTGISGDLPGTNTHLAAQVPGGSDLYMKNIQSPVLPAPKKIWDVFVAAGVNSTSTVIRPLLYTVSSTTLPPSSFEGTPLQYFVVMLDNKGMEGAPANGTSWAVTLPTVHSSTVPFWTCPVNLPVVKMSEKSNAALAADGYKLELVQVAAVPEPSSMLALGSGLFGLAGFVIRRRRA